MAKWRLRPRVTCQVDRTAKDSAPWIEEAKKEETRQRRLQKAVTMLKKGVKSPR